MTIQLHPEAAKRFDELGKQLLVKVVPEPPLSRIQETFRPDIHPVMHIPQHDIIGGVGVTQSMIDGTGEEVGRFFRNTIPKIGLIGDGFRALKDLSERFQTHGDLRDVASFGFIRDAAFDWIEFTHKGQPVGTLSEYISKRVNGELKEFEIWVPLFQTYLESTIPMGPVTLRTITREMLDEAEAKVPLPNAETAAAVRLAFARDRSAVQGCAGVVLRIRAEQNKAMETARQQAEVAAALLRFLSPANWTPKLRSYCVPLGSENVRRRAELFVENDSINTYSRGVLDSAQPLVLSNAYLAQFPRLLDRLSALWRESERLPFQQDLYDVLLVYSRNSIAVEPADKLIYILVALESILLRNESEPIGQNVSERMAFLSGDSLATRKAILANAKEVYRLRSAFVHHGQSIKDVEALSTFMLNAWTCFYNLIMTADRYQTKDNLILAIENRKMS